jgi:NAD(P)-dependent dehydrogenase (short-subunit alcohol dehydrogenase family)
VTRRVAVVTGGARGIGAAVAERLAADGDAVIVLDVDGEGAESVAARLRDGGSEAAAIAVDVSSADEVEAAIGRVRERFGRLDVLVNNAGRNSYLDPGAATEDEWDAAFAIDLKAAWLVARAALPELLAARGAIVNVTSIHARLTTPGMFPYAAAKAGLEGLTRSLAVEYAPRGLRVNAVAPGWTRTALVTEWLARQDDPDALARVEAAHPLGFIAEPADVAAAVAFLAGPGARAITGAVLPVDAGLSVTFRVD